MRGRANPKARHADHHALRMPAILVDRIGKHGVEPFLQACSPMAHLPQAHRRVIARKRHSRKVIEGDSDEVMLLSSAPTWRDDFDRGPRPGALR